MTDQQPETPEILDSPDAPEAEEGEMTVSEPAKVMRIGTMRLHSFEGLSKARSGQMLGARVQA